MANGLSRAVGRAAKDQAGEGGGLPAVLGTLYLRFVALTSTVLWDGLAYHEAAEARGLVYAFWHGRQACLTFTHAGRAAAVLVSRSKDGEIIAGVLGRFGLRTVRGSSSRGGRAALKGLLEAGRGGLRPAVTPDGPRGPAGQVKPGALYLAARLGVPILPVSSAARRKIVFKSWDAFQLPLPFNRVAVVYGRPIEVKPGDSLKERARELKAELDRAGERAEALVA